MGRGFSASTIKSWFQYRCERKVRYELSTDAELASVPVVEDQREHAWAILGNAFEDRVIGRLARDHHVLLPPAHEKALSERLTAAFLRCQRRETYAAQVNLRPRTPPAFLQGTGLFLNRNLPDLIRREDPTCPNDPVRFTVIDVKATRRATAFHKTQVGFYVRVLEEVLRELAQVDSVRAAINPTGEIWRIPDDGSADGDAWQVEQFGLAPYLRLVDEFCGTLLPQIAAKRVSREIDETFFHIYFKCEQCKYLEHCSKAIAPERQPERRDVSAVPGLSHEGKRALARLNVRSVGVLSRAAGLARASGVGWSLSRRAPQLIMRAKAIAEGVVLRTEEQQTFLMPPRADAMLLLSVDHDPVDDRLAAIGYRRIEEGRVRNEKIEVVKSGATADEAEAIINVLGALIVDLTEIDAANRSGEFPSVDEGIHAHILFYEPIEATNLQLAIGRHLENENIRKGLLHIVRLFPPDDVVPEPEFRGVHHLPATAVRSVMEQLWALPVAVAYDLRQVSQALAAVGGGPAYAPQPSFERPFSSLLSIDVIRPLRDGHKSAVAFAEIERDVRQRLDALEGVIDWIFAEQRRADAAGGPLLRLAKKPFRFHTSFDPLNAVDLDVLLACEILENRAGLLEALIRLAQSAERRRDIGRCLAGLTLSKHWQYGGQEVLLFSVPEASRDAELGPTDFDLILTDDSPDLRLDPSVWPELACSIRPKDDGYEHRLDIVQVSMNRRNFNGPLMQGLLRQATSNTWHIDRGFRDFNSQKAVDFLRNLAHGDAV